MSSKSSKKQELYGTEMFEETTFLLQLQCFICNKIPVPAYSVDMNGKRKLICMKCWDIKFGNYESEEYVDTQLIAKLRMKCSNFRCNFAGTLDYYRKYHQSECVNDETCEGVKEFNNNIIESNHPMINDTLKY